MCLGIPMRVVKIEGKTGTAETAGVERPVRFDLLTDVKQGDYVLIHAGYAIQKLSQEDAEETLKLLQEFLLPGEDGSEVVGNE